MQKDISASDYNLFIENNALRYMEEFSDNEDKKFFIHTNWSAFFATGPWMLYRKMYKKAIAVILFLVILFSGSLFISLNVGENLKVAIDKEPINYEKFEILNDDEVREHLSGQDIANVYADYDEKLVKKASVDFWVWAIPIILFFTAKLLLSLFADSIYRGFIRKNITTLKGGTSGTAATVCSCVYIGIFLIAVFIVSIM